MATSGSNDFSLSARQVITYALQKINMLAKHETPSPEMASTAMRELNLMLKGWQKYEHLWNLTEGYISLTANTAGYSLTPKPHRIIDVRYRNTGGTDMPMSEMTRQEYYELPQKTATGIPTQWYFDKQGATRALYIWPVMSSATTETLRVTYRRKIEDIDDLDDDLDVPQEHLEVVGYNLAARLSDDFGRAGDHINRIIARAQLLLNDVLDDDREDFIQFVPERR